jgi:ADP-ribosylglycohydrolase
MPPSLVSDVASSSSDIMQKYISSVSSLKIISRPSADGSLEEDRVMGAFLGSLCGNVLAAPLVSDRSYQVPSRHPDGVTSFFAHDIGEVPMKRGQHDGYFSTLLATTRGCLAKGRVNSEAIAQEMALLEPECFSRDRRYPPYAKLIIDTLNGPSLPLPMIPELARIHLAKTAQASSQITGDRPEHEYRGPDDNGGVARILPVAFLGGVDEDIKEALIFSHTDSAVDSARVFSAAIVWLSRQISPLSLDGTETAQSRVEVNAIAMNLGAALITHLLSVAATEVMKEKLLMVQGRLFQLDKVDKWRNAFKSDEWSRLLMVHSQVTHKGHASYGVESVAAALVAFCYNIAAGPKQAVVASASLAGSSASVVSQLTGALSGSLFGDKWLPYEWTGHLEPAALEETAALAKAILRIRPQ